MTARNVRTLAALLALPLVFACGDKESDEDEEGWGLDDTAGSSSGDDGCGTMDAFVYGTVTGPGGSDPNVNAEVYAYNPTADLTQPGEMQGDGSYELNIQEGTWIVYATDGICWSDDVTLDAEACTEVPLDIEITECDTADKPNLYLYPEVDTAMHVEVRHSDRQSIVASAPLHGAEGWTGIAHPDGTFSVDGERWPFLFYEVSLEPWQGRRFQRSEGWCLPEADAHQAMADLLGEYGFNAREREDFVEGWEHDLPPNAGGYAVFPQLEVAHAAGLRMSHAMPVDRLWLVVEDGAGCTALPEPAVVPFERGSVHGVEWGVVLHDLVR